MDENKDLIPQEPEEPEQAPKKKIDPVVLYWIRTFIGGYLCYLAWQLFGSILHGTAVGRDAVICGNSASVVSDCIISNNVSGRSAAAQFGTYRRCRILENRANQIASAVRQGRLETCWVARNGDNATLYYCDAYDCTIGPGNGTSCVSECRNLKNTVLADNQDYSVETSRRLSRFLRDARRSDNASRQFQHHQQ